MTVVLVVSHREVGVPTKFPGTRQSPFGETMITSPHVISMSKLRVADKPDSYGHSAETPKKSNDSRKRFVGDENDAERMSLHVHEPPCLLNDKQVPLRPGHAASLATLLPHVRSHAALNADVLANEFSSTVTHCAFA